MRMSGAVAPHAGAWIEMLVKPTFDAIANVAPHAGAWIEMYAITSAD